MNLQGKELVSQATQRTARQLVATALAVLLAKLYAVPLQDLQVLGVQIPIEAVRGAVFLVLSFQIANHIVHWWGDFQSLAPWNSSQRVNGLPRIGVASSILTKLDAALERLEDQVKRSERRFEHGDQAKLDEVILVTQQCKDELEKLQVSARRFNLYSGFYFFVWYLGLPVVLGSVAMLIRSAVL